MWTLSRDHVSLRIPSARTQTLLFLKGVKASTKYSKHRKCESEEKRNGDAKAREWRQTLEMWMRSQERDNGAESWRPTHVLTPCELLVHIHLLPTYTELRKYPGQSSNWRIQAVDLTKLESSKSINLIKGMAQRHMLSPYSNRS